LAFNEKLSDHPRTLRKIVFFGTRTWTRQDGQTTDLSEQS